MSLNPNEEQLEVELFIDPPDQDLICSICWCVLKDAKEINTCKHLYCNQCITTHFRSKSFCPTDKRPATTANLGPPPRPIVNIISRLQLKCFYGCGNVMSVETLLGQHNRVCPNRSRGVNTSGRAPTNVPSNDGVPISVFVKLASPAKTIVVTITTEATVRILKQRIHEKEGIDPNNLVLNFKGKTLQDHEILSRYGVKNNDTFYITRRFDGGAHIYNIY